MPELYDRSTSVPLQQIQQLLSLSAQNQGRMQQMYGRDLARQQFIHGTMMDQLNLLERQRQFDESLGQRGEELDFRREQEQRVAGQQERAAGQRDRQLDISEENMKIAREKLDAAVKAAEKQAEYDEQKTLQRTNSAWSLLETAMPYMSDEERESLANRIFTAIGTDDEVGFREAQRAFQETIKRGIKQQEMERQRGDQRTAAEAMLSSRGFSPETVSTVLAGFDSEPEMDFRDALTLAESMDKSESITKVFGMDVEVPPEFIGNGAPLPPPGSPEFGAVMEYVGGLADAIASQYVYDSRMPTDQQDAQREKDAKAIFNVLLRFVLEWREPLPAAAPQ